MIGIGYILIGIFSLFVPGFILSFLLFSEPESLDFWERIATSVGLSALIVMLIITILAQPTFSALRFFPLIGSILVFCIASAIILFFRKDSFRTFVDFWKRSG
ncbi:hypothetical protein AKJ54_00590 [candidate division MSBL1 archaeon SCGC-AAA382K21]|uniref:Uncharacterized protein n=1 Tax=candidate division MSBL1 archaeon SCGC-AAA382K21 TaxID=1698283 RepID=A0A133VL45_9EURY|nr:hypothetical protein AKJ54_00590 [candidate division MSBL1 archaeon SCGC-AAA382K21]